MVMRGGVTTGDRSIFSAYKRGKQGSCYGRTEVFHVGEDSSNLDWILGVLIDWVGVGSVPTLVAILNGQVANRLRTRLSSNLSSTSTWLPRQWT